MSRRFRIEEEKSRKLNEELEDEEIRLKAQQERIYAPVTWRRLSSGICIQDLKPHQYDQVLQIIQECYFQEEVLCRNSNLGEDSESVKSFLNHVRYYLGDRTSIIALDESNDNVIAGFLVLTVMHKENFSGVSSRVKTVEGEAFKKFANFTNYIGRKANVYAELECDKYLRYLLLCIRPEYRRQGLGLQFFLSGVDVARSFYLPVVMGIFSCWTMQKLARRIGMRVLHEIQYVAWRDKFDELVFPEPGQGNYTFAVMAGLLPPPPKPEPPPLIIDENPAKTTREERRKLKEKGKKKEQKQEPPPQQKK